MATSKSHSAETHTTPPAREAEIRGCYLCGGHKSLDRTLAIASVFICRNCLLERRQEGEYKLISQTNGLRKFALTPNDLYLYGKYGPRMGPPEVEEVEEHEGQDSDAVSLDRCSQEVSVENGGGGSLIVITRKNPRGYQKEMKLYYEFQLREIAILKHGSLSALEKVLEQQEEERFRKAIGGPPPSQKNGDRKVRARKKSTTKMDLSALEELLPSKKPHLEHQFSEPVLIDEVTNTFEKVCSECGAAEKWEEL